MLHKHIYKMRKNLCYWLFKDILQDETTDMLHPEFGWYWRDDESGGRLLKQARTQGYRTALKDIQVMIKHGDSLENINRKLSASNEWSE
jgi:hypothetical protein